MILLVIGFIGKNSSLIIAVLALLLVKWVGLGDKVFPFMQAKGLPIAITILTVAVLVPIATGEIGFTQLKDALKSYYAWIALASGVLVALIAKGGVELLQSDPHITAALVIGTILAVAFFNGVAVGPLIGAGIAYAVMKVVELFSASGG